MSDGHLKDHERHLKRIEKSRSELIDRRDRLVSQIRQAFAAVTRDGGVSIREAYVIDNWGSDDDRAAARASETDDHWWNVDIRTLDPAGGALCFFDGIGFRYYLPAYMTHTLQHGLPELDETRDSDWDATDRLISSLCPPGYVNLERTNQLRSEYYSLFSKSQCTCIARFLSLMAELQVTDLYVADALDALRTEWINHLPHQERKHIEDVWPQLRA